MAAIAFSLVQLYTEPIGYQWFFLAALTLLSGSATVKLQSVPATISTSEAFVFTSVLLFGPAAGTLTVALDGLVITYWLARRKGDLCRLLFNVAAPALSIWVGSTIFFLAAGVSPLFQQPSAIGPLIVPLAIFAIVYFVLNSWLIAIAISFERGDSPFDVWRHNFLWLSLNYFGGASVAALFVLVAGTSDISYPAFIASLLLVAPLLLVLYLTFRISIERAEDAHRHLQQLNRLYLSTIETLAMAIDAKDQVTHGHIRRVQHYAVGLAKAMGVTDSSQIKAIEAAALLHDMGKLAVPEYILNKPGRLTHAEFERMKSHAAVGADILSAIDFPYPVVPIVRHHHESWDGTGYPDGLKGTNIPVGARILSVVDCFDALTSDRPYRPRLSDAEAVRILVQRRGTMYDPLVVDAFVDVHAAIDPQKVEIIASRTAFAAISASSMAQVPEAQPTAGLSNISASTEEMLALYGISQALAGRVSLADAGDIIAKHLRRIVPAATCVFFTYDASSSEILAAHSVGEHSDLILGTRIPLGQRLTGWVAANRQTIVNSDPVLDFGEAICRLTPRLRTCLSTPLTWQNELVGALSLYSSSNGHFTEDHCRVVEAVAGQVSRAVKQAVEGEETRVHSLRDSVTGLPNIEHLRQFVDCALSSGRIDDPMSLVLIDIRGLDVTGTLGAGDRELLTQIANACRMMLRGADVLFRYGRSSFIVLLMLTDASVCQPIAVRIQAAVDLIIRKQGRSSSVAYGIGTATAPQDGRGLRQLADAAARRLGRPRMESDDDHSSRSIH